MVFSYPEVRKTGEFAMATKGADDNIVFCDACSGSGFDLNSSSTESRCAVCGGAGIVKNANKPLTIFDDDADYWRQLAERVRALSTGEPPEHQGGF